MTNSDYVFTSESVSEGHPDKVCDRISDAVVDLYLAGDPHSRVAVETMTTTNRIVIAGEVRGPANVDERVREDVVRQAVRDIGYEQDGFHWEHAKLDDFIHAQSTDIAQGVDAAGNKDEGAGDQGIMFGYATDETNVLMPAPITYAHRLMKQQAILRRSGKLNWLCPDAKSQVTFKYLNGKPVSIDAIVISTQHRPDISQTTLKEAVIEEMIKLFKVYR